MRLTARNVLRGRATRLGRGAGHLEVAIEPPGRTEIVSAITLASGEAPGRAVGREAERVLPASSVLVGVS